MIPVDLDRLRGVAYPVAERVSPCIQSVFKTNGLSEPKATEKFVTRSHAVLAVGCGDNTFILNDPATFPFLEARIDQIFDAGCYIQGSRTELCKGLILPVTPHGVKLPLLSPVPETTASSQKPAKRPGLFAIIAALQNYSGSGFPQVIDPWRTSDFRLCQLAELPQRLQTYKRFATADTLAVDLLQDLLLNHSIQSTRYCWIQFALDSGTVWIWDGERPAVEVTVPAARSHLIAILTPANPWEFKIFREVSPFSRNTTEATTALHPGLKTLSRSVITSLSVRGLDSSLAVLRKCERLELYAAMQSDAVSWLPNNSQIWRECWAQFCEYSGRIWLRNVRRFANPLEYFRAFRHYLKATKEGRLIFHLGRKLAWTMPISTMVDRMYQYRYNEGRKDKIAQSIAQQMRGREGKIVALASYIPEIVSHRISQREKAVAALLFLIGLASRLRSPKVIEFVGGSRIDGIWQGVASESSPNDRSVHVATVLSDEVAFFNLMESLDKVVDQARKQNIRLALELEPGPLFVVRDLKTVRSFCEHLANPRFDGIVGLNLDIAHWHLAGITPDEIDDDIGKRIFHAHISDHSIGHFGDVSVGVNNGIPFQKWIDVLKRVAVKHTAFSGYVSVELEACKHAEMLEYEVASN